MFLCPCEAVTRFGWRKTIYRVIYVSLQQSDDDDHPGLQEDAVPAQELQKYGGSRVSSQVSRRRYPRYTTTIVANSGRMVPAKRSRSNPMSSASSARPRTIRRICSLR